MNFTEYRDGPAGKIAEVILDKSMVHLTTWQEFFCFTYVVSCVGDEGRKIMERAKHAYVFGHTGGRAVVLGTLFAMVRSAHAVKLEADAGENLLSLLTRADDKYRDAVAACLQLKD